MAQNITLLGASYSDVPSVLLPKTGGGTASFTDVTDTTAAASDVASGKYFYTAAGVLTQGTASGGSAVIQPLSVTQNGTYTAPTGVDGYSPVTVNVSGGGGASNIVTGTFTGTTTGVAMDVTLNYTGSGYPIIFATYPTGGANNSDTSFYNLTQRYACVYFVGIKCETDTTPTYASGGNGNISQNSFSVYQRYKNSATSTTSHSGTAVKRAYVAKDDAAASGNSSDTNVILRFRSKTSMSVFIASTSYGFAANIEYTYYVIYSS